MLFNMIKRSKTINKLKIKENWDWESTSLRDLDEEEEREMGEKLSFL